LKKPFNLKELKIRIDRLTSQIPQASELVNELVIRLSNQYSFNSETNILYFNNEAQRFTKRESALITLFVSNIGQIISYQNIRTFIWDGEDAEDSTIRSLVNRVRRKLKEELIENIRGFGYILHKQES